MNIHYLNRYNAFIERIRQLGNRDLEYSEKHHIKPRCMGGSDEPDNLITLSLREHFLCHWMLYKAYPKHLGLASAFLQMVNKNSKTNKPQDFKITSRVYEQLKIAVYQMLSEHMTNRVYVKNADNETFYMSKEEYAAQSDIVFHTKGKIYVFDKQTESWVYISSIEYQTNKDRYITRLSRELYDHKKELDVNLFRYLDLDSNEIVKMSKYQATDLNEHLGRKRYKQVIESKVTYQDENGNKHIIKAKDYDPKTHTHVLKNKVNVWDLQLEKQRIIPRTEYDFNPARYLTSTKGKIIALDTNTGKSCLIDKKLFDGVRYVGVTKNLTTVLDKSTGQYVQISRDQVLNNKERYAGPCAGKINIINKQTGIRSQVPQDQFDKNVHLSLGNKKYLFKCQHVKTGKIKNINIYEWHLVQDLYVILDEKKFLELKNLL